MQTDLNLQGLKYNTAVTIFFVPYALLFVPANIFMKHLWPAKSLAISMSLFGLLSSATGHAKNHASLLACRFFLGWAESFMLGGCFYLLGMWYTRDEAARRFSLLFQSAAVAGILGGLMASAIGKSKYTAVVLSWAYF